MAAGVVIPFLIPVTWLRQLKYFTTTNMIANFMVVASVTYMVSNFASQLLQSDYGEGIVWLADGQGLLRYRNHIHPACHPDVFAVEPHTLPQPNTCPICHPQP